MSREHVTPEQILRYAEALTHAANLLIKAGAVMQEQKISSIAMQTRILRDDSIPHVLASCQDVYARAIQASGTPCSPTVSPSTVKHDD